jgi:hypothetical protein
MNRNALVIAALIALPSLAAAQRGGTRTQSDKRTDMFSKEDEQGFKPSLHTSDLEDQSPLKLLIDKHKDLKLTDPQLAQMKDGETALKTKDAPILKLADSLINAMKKTGSDDDRAYARRAAGALSNVIEALRANYDTAGTAAVAQLDPEQQTKAKELIEKQKQETTDMLKKKMGGK